MLKLQSTDVEITVWHQILMLRQVRKRTRRKAVATWWRDMILFNYPNIWITLIYAAIKLCMWAIFSLWNNHAILIPLGCIALRYYIYTQQLPWFDLKFSYPTFNVRSTSEKFDCIQTKYPAIFLYKVQSLLIILCSPRFKTMERTYLKIRMS